jgi:hypothetical protein
LTPSQRAAIVAFHLAHGAGLTVPQVRQLARYPKTTKEARVTALLRAIEPVVAAHAVDDVWAAYLQYPPAAPQSPRARAAWVARQLAQHGEVSIRALVEDLGISRQATFNMLARLACVLPLYTDEARPGVWRVLEMRELDD